MFGIGSGELFFIVIVALIVLGPERLPKAARFVGLWVRRARAHWYSVKDELERELAAEELKRGLDGARASVREMEASLREQGGIARRELEQVREAVESPGEDEGAAAPPPPDTAAQAQAPTPSEPQAELPLDPPRPGAEEPDARRD